MVDRFVFMWNFDLFTETIDFFAIACECAHETVDFIKQTTERNDNTKNDETDLQLGGGE